VINCAYAIYFAGCKQQPVAVKSIERIAPFRVKEVATGLKAKTAAGKK
jgi:hypothetical protein